MNPLLRSMTYILLMGIVIFLSCQKELSCENCSSKKPPIANAGSDQTILLPTDSVTLDGSASYDPDGTLSSLQWTKISGPASFTINNAAAARTVVKNLAAGSYQFELKVTDNGGLSAKDTMQLIVNDPAQPNRPPVANAGADQTITLPTNTVNLDGSGSTDPDNNITSYKWTKISGPSSFNIANSTTVQTGVANLTEGVYQFELKVTDAGGLSAKDTMKVIVNSAVASCNVTQTQIGNLSIPRDGARIVEVGNKILFAGRLVGGNVQTVNNTSTRVDIYDITSGSWTTAELSVPRFGIAEVASGKKIYFAGGRLGDGSFSTRVDIYDVTTNTWSTAELSEPRDYIQAETVGNKVVFAGGQSANGFSTIVDVYDLAQNTWSVATLSGFMIYPIGITSGNKIFFSVGDHLDVYDASNNNWSTVTLSQPRSFISPVTLGNKVYLGGGESPPPIVSNKVDVYDGATNTWSVTTLAHAKYALFRSISADNKIFWAGGVDSLNEITDGCNSDVEIYDAITGNHSFHSLLSCFPFSFLINNKVVFISGTMADQYDINTQSWSTCSVPHIESMMILVNNKIYGTSGPAVLSFTF